MTDKDASREGDAIVGRRPIDQPNHRPGGSGHTHVTKVESIEGEGQLKVGHNRHFTVYCDEPPRVGGTDKYPSPSPICASAWTSDCSPSLRGTHT